MEPIEKQVTVLMQGSEFGDTQIKEMMTQELRQRLTEASKEGRPLEVYCGYDVTAPDLHVGHTITMRKLRQFQDFGHNVTFVIGTFTTLIGDPSDRDEARTVQTMEQIEANARTYTDQAFKILDRQKTTVRFNYDWLSKLTFADVIKAASYFTVQQMLTRDRLRNRWDANKPLGLHELLYPLAQGYDAVHLHSDVQIGATEQLFNLMAGRKLQESFGQKPQVCITFPVLVGTDGTDRMSKSRGNYIGITEAPEVQYGKAMSIPDSIIIQYFRLLTNLYTDEELAKLEQQMSGGAIHPMELKKRLAREIVTQLNDKQAADEAEAQFEKVVQKKEVPEVMTLGTKSNRTPLLDYLVENSLARSLSEARRLIKEGAIYIDNARVTDAHLEVKPGMEIRRGSRHYIRAT
ncbi:MAG: tyrosine--tRNA ligase [Chloroflexota bacterium]